MAGFGFRDTDDALGNLLGRDWDYDQVGHAYLNAFYDKDVAGDHRNSIYDRLCDWMQDEYGLDFENWIDWDEYRAWYNGSE